MSPKRTSVGVWLDGIHVADLEQRRWPEIRCRYTAEALDRWPANSPVLSCCLPLDKRPQDALAFCKGVLPEGQALQTLASKAGLATSNTLGLLMRFGRDVAGALIVSDQAPEARAFGVEAFDDKSLEAAVDDLDRHPLGAHDDSELSLAGLQDKLLLVRTEDGGWGRPLHGRPSTHILKVDHPRLHGLVDAEGQCLGLAAHVGLTSIEHEMLTLGDLRCLVVSRFDRVPEKNGIRRLHQEDACQALAIDPDGGQRRAKYQNAGGPGFRDIAGLLDRYGQDPAAELRQLLRAATFTVLIGNADAHGKNVALLHDSPETISLAPLYDTVPTVLWPKLRTDAAMTIGGRVSLPKVTADDLEVEARSWPMSAKRARAVIAELVDEVADGLAGGVLDESSPLGKFVASRVEQMRASSN